MVEMITPAYYGIIFGMAGFLIAGPLTMRGEILDWWPKLVRWIIRASPDPGRNTNLQLYISKLAFGCSKCIAGQLALWISLLVFESIGHIAASVVVAIFSAYFIEQRYEG